MTAYDNRMNLHEIRTDRSKNSDVENLHFIQSELLAKLKQTEDLISTFSHKEATNYPESTKHAAYRPQQAVYRESRSTSRSGQKTAEEEKTNDLGTKSIQQLRNLKGMSEERYARLERKAMDEMSSEEQESGVSSTLSKNKYHRQKHIDILSTKPVPRPNEAIQVVNQTQIRYDAPEIEDEKIKQVEEIKRRFRVDQEEPEPCHSTLLENSQATSMKSTY